MNPPSTWVRIRDIGPGNDNLIIRGIILRKQDPRVIRMRRDNAERCVWSFTLRDSPVDLINASIWGSPEYVHQLYPQFRIGDVVSLVDVKAVPRTNRDRDEYQPTSNSSFSISLNESQSRMFADPKYSKEFEHLRAIPTQPEGNFLTINDIIENGQKLIKQFVNLLAAVHDVHSVRQFTSKSGQPLECRDVILIDESHRTLVATIWGTDLLGMSENWIPRKTVLFFADVRVDWNDYKKMFVVSTSSRTIVTENPRTSKAQILANFMNSVPFQASGKLEQILCKYTNPSMMNKVMSCQMVLTMADDERTSNEFPALVYALLVNFEIDGNKDSITICKCMRCLFKVDPDMEVCLNANCPSANGSEPPLVERVYDLRVNLLDHTGHLVNCKLLDRVATKLIGLKAPLFYELRDEERSAMKWRHLLRYFAARIVVLPIRGKTPVISILFLDPISVNDYSRLVPMF